MPDNRYRYRTVFWKTHWKTYLVVSLLQRDFSNYVYPTIIAFYFQTRLLLFLRHKHSQSIWLRLFARGLWLLSGNSLFYGFLTFFRDRFVVFCFFLRGGVGPWRYFLFLSIGGGGWGALLSVGKNKDPQSLEQVGSTVAYSKMSFIYQFVPLSQFQ